MKTPNTGSIVCMIGGFTLMASLLTWHSELFGLGVKPPPVVASASAIKPAGLRVQRPFNAAALPYPGNSMLGYDEMLAVSRFAKNIGVMLRAAKAPLAEVCPRGLRDPDGRLGIIIVCSQPLVTPTKSPGMNDRKAWVVLAVIASAKYSANNPVNVDYIGLTDPQGLSDERWYYEFNMNAARRVHRNVCSGGLTLEQGYEEIVAAWRRITATEYSDYDHKAAAIGTSDSH